jgi:hypothetical protein
MNESNFHPNPQVRRAREADGGKKQPEGKKPIEKKDDAGKGPAHSVEISRKDDGSGYHSITRHADGNEDHQDHASYDEAEQHARSMHGEDGDDMGEMEEESSEVCPDCNGEGCETCGGTGVKQAQAEGDLS